MFVGRAIDGGKKAFLLNAQQDGPADEKGKRRRAQRKEELEKEGFPFEEKTRFGRDKRVRKIEAEDGDVRKDEPKERLIEREGKAERGLALPRIARPEAEAADADDRRDDGRRVEDEPEEECEQALERRVADDGREQEGKSCKPARDPREREEVGFLPLQQAFRRLFAL